MSNSISRLIRKIRNIGMSDNITSEDAKYIFLINMYGLVASLINLCLILFSFIGYYFYNEPLLATLITVVCIMLNLFTFVLTSNKRFTLARIYALTITFVAVIVSTSYFGVAFRIYDMLLVVAIAAAVLFPKSERKWMVGIIILCLAGIIIIGLGYNLGYLKAYYPIETIMASRDILNVRSMTVLFVFITSILLALIAHNMAMSAEDQLREERQKVLDLSNKMKVYLPLQFVDSLAKNDQDAGPGYKRKKLTVFFSDIKGFTAWTDKLQPEDMQEILNLYLSEMSKIAHKWGGTIDKFIGDAIMIFFGDPEFTNDKDHALRCVKMAMEMQTKMGNCCAEWEDRGHDEPLHIRIGINTGYATVGTFGSGDRFNYTALGTTVNLASRLETTCVPDKITISHSTYSLIKNEIECVPRGMIEVKGIIEPVKIYEVVGEKS
ncbi:MAG: adenylate/guanylate cyclase domain-containing protein [Candidatus Zixiibacteriota bacterium]